MRFSLAIGAREMMLKPRRLLGNRGDLVIPLPEQVDLVPPLPEVGVRAFGFPFT